MLSDIKTIQCSYVLNKLVYMSTQLNQQMTINFETAIITS